MPVDWRRRRPWGALAALGLHAGLFFAVVAATAITIPYSDMLDWVARHETLEASGDWLAYLFQPHLNHRIPYIFGLLDLDIRAFGGSGWPLIVAAALCLAATAAMLAREAFAAAPGGLGAAGAAIAAMLVLTTPNALDASQPINGLYTHALLFAVLALVLVEEDGRLSRRKAAAAFLAGCAAAFGNAAALALFPALLFRRWRSGARLPELAAWLAAAAVFVAAYLRGQAPAASLEPTAAWLLQAVLEFLACLGLPWSAVIELAPWAPGLVLLPVALWAALIRGGREAPRAERVAAGLVLFGLGVAAMYALGRSVAGATIQPPLRYAVFLAPLHVGLGMLLLPALMRVQPRLAPRATAALIIALLVQQAASAIMALSIAANIRARIAEFHAGQLSPQVLLTVHPDPARARAIYAGLRERGLYQP